MHNKHEFVGVIEVRNSNPNGDRETNNMPRMDMATGIGEISDVCLKRKVRETMRAIYPDVQLYTDNDRPLNAKVGEVAEQYGMTLDELKDAMKHDKTVFRSVFEALLAKYADIRTFGAVFAKLNQHVQGPVQFAFGQSVEPIEVKTIAMTRKGIATNEKFSEEGATTMFGEKHVVPYALYVFKGEISAVQAEMTGFTEEDKERFFTALTHMFDFDRTAVRSDVNLRCLYDFECADRLGLDAPAWQLWDALQVTPVPNVRDGLRIARAYEDYEVVLHEDRIPASVTVHQLV